MNWTTIATSLCACILGGLANVPAAETSKSNALPERIGVYDSRVVAYAHFWSEAYQKEINGLMTAAREARTNGPAGRFAELEAKLKQAQEINHLQVFSTAPVDEILADMKAPLAAIRNATGVSRFLSKWDKTLLEPNQTFEKVDVTDQLLSHYKLTAQQKKMVEELRKQQPLPLAKASELMRQGKL